MEYRYVGLPTEGKQVRSEQVEDFATQELMRDWVSNGWEPISATRPSSIGKIGFLLRRATS